MLAVVKFGPFITTSFWLNFVLDILGAVGQSSHNFVQIWYCSGGLVLPSSLVPVIITDLSNYPGIKIDAFISKFSGVSIHLHYSSKTT
jgi:hypothetical protein